MSESELETKAQQLNRELMVMKADFDDLLKRMEKWSKEFFENYCKSNDQLDKKET